VKCWGACEWVLYIYHAYCSFIIHRCVLCVHSLVWLLEIRKIKKGKLLGAEKTVFEFISFLYRYNQLGCKKVILCNSVYYRDTESTMNRCIYLSLAYKSHSRWSGEKLNFAHYLRIFFMTIKLIYHQVCGAKGWYTCATWIFGGFLWILVTFLAFPLAPTPAPPTSPTHPFSQRQKSLAGIYSALDRRFIAFSYFYLS
jgi:hypothetical protein